LDNDTGYVHEFCYHKGEFNPSEDEAGLNSVEVNLITLLMTKRNYEGRIDSRMKMGWFH